MSDKRKKKKERKKNDDEIVVCAKKGRKKIVIKNKATGESITLSKSGFDQLQKRLFQPARAP